MIEDLYMREIQLAAEKGLLMIITFNWEQFPRAFFHVQLTGMYTYMYLHLTTVLFSLQKSTFKCVYSSLRNRRRAGNKHRAWKICQKE